MFRTFLELLLNSAVKGAWLMAGPEAELTSGPIALFFRAVDFGY